MFLPKTSAQINWISTGFIQIFKKYSSYKFCFQLFWLSSMSSLPALAEQAAQFLYTYQVPKLSPNYFFCLFWGLHNFYKAECHYRSDPIYLPRTLHTYHRSVKRVTSFMTLLNGFRGHKNSLAHMWVTWKAKLQILFYDMQIPPLLN